MPRDPWLHVDADARDLPAPPAPPPGPHAGVTGVPLGGYAERGERVDERLLQGAKVPVQIRRVAGQVDDRVADEPARPAERHVPPTLDLEDLHSPAAEGMNPLGGAAPRQQPPRFQEEQHA